MLALPQEIKSHEIPLSRNANDFTSGHNFSDIHILAVDDSLIDRKVIERLLKTASYKVTTADTALRALEVLGVADGTSPSCTNVVQVNLILTDYCMPGMTGYDLLRRVKTSVLKELPVVIMSTEDVPDRINMCLADGAEEFILKPLRMADVKRLKVHVRQRLPAVVNELNSDIVSDQNCKDGVQDTRVPVSVCPKRKILIADEQSDKSPISRPRLHDE